MNKLCARLILCVLGVLGIAGSAGAERPLRLGMTVWPGYEPLHLAARKDLLDESHVKIVSYRSATQAMQALRTSAIEACALTLDEVVTLTCGGLPLTIVMVVDISSGGDSIVGQPGISSMAELRGKRVAVESTALGAFMLLRALEKSGLSEEEVIPVRMEVARHVQAFESGAVAASVCFEPTRSTLIGFGGRELFSSAEIPGEIVDVIAVRTDALPLHRPSLKHLGAAWDAALRHMGDEPEESYKVLGERMGQRAEEARASYAGLTLYTSEASGRLLSSSPFKEGTLPRLLEFMANRGLVQQTIAPDVDSELVSTKGAR